MQSHLQKLPPMAANLRRDDDDKRRETTTDDDRRRQTTRSNPHTPNYKREPFATHSGKTQGVQRDSIYVAALERELGQTREMLNQVLSLVQAGQPPVPSPPEHGVPAISHGPDTTTRSHDRGTKCVSEALCVCSDAGRVSQSCRECCSVFDAASSTATRSKGLATFLPRLRAD